MTAFSSGASQFCRGQRTTTKSAILFTLEIETSNEEGSPFLDTTTSGHGTEIEADVYRKPIRTDCYLDFLLCHPLALCHKRSVVNTSLRRAKSIASRNEGRQEEATSQSDTTRKQLSLVSNTLTFMITHLSLVPRLTMNLLSLLPVLEIKKSHLNF